MVNVYWDGECCQWTLKDTALSVLQESSPEIPKLKNGYFALQ